MTWTAGQIVTAPALNAAFAAKFDAGAVSSYGATIVLAANASAALTVLGLPTGGINAANGVPQLDGSAKIPLSLLPAAVAGAMSYQGTWNANTNSPTLVSGTGTKGYFYKVSVAGSTTIDTISQWNVGDLIAFNGTTWDKIDGIPSEVLSVAGRTGVVTIASTDLTDSTSVGRALVTASSVNVQRVALNIENWNAVANANATLAAGKVNYTWTSLSASRTATLLAATAYNPGQVICLQDGSGNASPSVSITAVVNPTPGTDTIVGASSITSARGELYLVCDGVSKFYGVEVASYGTAAGQAIRLNSSAQLPAVDGSLLTGISATWASGALYGLTLSRASVTTFTVASGACRNEDGGTAVNMTLASAMTKSLSSWVAGNNNGGLDTGSVAANTWYHVHLIGIGTGSIDVLYSLSATAPTMPGSYTSRRRLGSFKTDGSSQIVLFSQNGDEFLWDAAVVDVDATNPGTSAVTRTLSVPTGVKVTALLNVGVYNGSTQGIGANVSALDISDQAPQTGTTAALGSINTVNANGVGASIWAFSHGAVRTNTSGQVRSRLSVSGAADHLGIITRGWIDTRGRT